MQLVALLQACVENVWKLIGRGRAKRQGLLSIARETTFCLSLPTVAHYNFHRVWMLETPAGGSYFSPRLVVFCDLHTAVFDVCASRFFWFVGAVFSAFDLPRRMTPFSSFGCCDPTDRPRVVSLSVGHRHQPGNVFA